MKLQLYIKAKLIEEVPVDMTNLPLVEQRMRRVKNTAEFIKYQYRDSLKLLKDWQIVLAVESKMNKKRIYD